MSDFVKATEDAKLKAEEKKVASSAKEEEEEGGDENPEKHESTAVFTPVVKLEEVEVVSGEEDEDVLLNK
jgi:Ran-binding protein 1